MTTIYTPDETLVFGDDKQAFRYLRECAKDRVPRVHIFFHKKNSGMTMELKGFRYIEKPFHPLLPFSQ